MKLVTRSQLGWPASAAGYIASVRGVKVHYLGSPYSSRSHVKCAAYVKQIRSSHLANKAENYSDIAYNALVCEHGTVFEGRGPHRRTGANGNASLNSQHYAVCGLLGSSGLTEPPDAMLSGIRDAIEYLREKGDAGSEIKGHRDGYATACPGGPLYAWVTKGAPRPAASKPAEPAPPKKEETEMTPAQEALLRQVAADVTSLRKDVATLKNAAKVDGWGYRNAALVAEAKAAGQPKPPDMHGRIQHIEQMLTTLTKEN